VFNRRDFIACAGLAAAGAMTRPLHALSNSSALPGDEAFSVDFGKTVSPLPHYWEKACGSDRAVIGLREQWREDLIRVRRETGMQSVRFHGLFNDEMGVARSSGTFNFLYIDKIYDFMLNNGVRPFVELSFMPEAFASSANRIFSYKGNVSPPRNWQDWYDLVQAFTSHCVKRYGIQELGGWKFEVWNEPNIDFWAGTQGQYFELYRQSVLAIKSVDKRLQVGGPSTAQLQWVPQMIQYCASQNLPLDFASSHVYPNDPQTILFGEDRHYTFEQIIPRGLEFVGNQIKKSSRPETPFWITEWSSQNPAFIADTIKNCIGLVESLSYWTFNNDFEELGVPTGIFNTTFGMIDQWGIARPSLHAFAFLHKLGEKRLQTDDGPILATERADGSKCILLWNLIAASDKSGVANGNPLVSGAGAHNEVGGPRTFHLKLNGLGGRKTVQVHQIDRQTGTAIPAWESMGSPASPSPDQIAQLRSAAELPVPQTRTIMSGSPAELSIVLPPDSVVLLEFER
jgi:xylan 1,4-beta-xylosidase